MYTSIYVYIYSPTYFSPKNCLLKENSLTSWRRKYISNLGPKAILYLHDDSLLSISHTHQKATKTPFLPFNVLTFKAFPKVCSSDFCESVNFIIIMFFGKGNWIARFLQITFYILFQLTFQNGSSLVHFQ